MSTYNHLTEVFHALTFQGGTSHKKHTVYMITIEFQMKMTKIISLGDDYIISISSDDTFAEQINI